MTSNDVDLAIVAALDGDAVLLALMPGGVYFDFAPAGRDQFVLVELFDHGDEYQFQFGTDGAPAFERFVYDVTAVEKAAAAINGERARQRIHELLQGVALTVAGYDHVKTLRTRYLRYATPDDTDRANRWTHRGGRYEVVVAPHTP